MEMNRTDRETLIEINATVRQIEVGLKELKEDLKQNYATRSELTNVRDDVSSLQDNQKWISRLLMGAFLSGIVVVAMTLQG